MFDTIRGRIILPFSVALLIMLLGGVFAAYQISNFQIHDHVDDLKKSLYKALETYEHKEIEGLAGAMDLLLFDEGLHAAWKTQSRKQLYNYTVQFYKSLNKRHNITHFYFHKLDQGVFLRMHRPDRFGDTIKRLTLVQAVKTGKASIGREMGVLGSFVLRYVQPWYVEGKLVGYIELGKEVDHLIRKAASVLDVDLFLFIKKQFLVRSEWEKLHRKGHHLHKVEAGQNDYSTWAAFPDVALTEHTASMPEFLDKLINVQYMSSDPNLELYGDASGHELNGGFLRLNDMSGQVVGYMLFLLDVADVRKAFQKVIIGLALGGLFIALLILAFFYRYLGRIQENISHSQSRLKQEVSKHRQTEEELQEINAELESYSYSIAHDLRAPLRSIVSFSQIVKEDADDRLDNSDRDHLNRVISAGQYMSELIDDILELSRVTRSELKLSDVDASSLAQVILQRFMESHPERNIKLILANDMVIHADHLLLERLLANLLGNAFKYTAIREQAIIEMGRKDGPGGAVFYIRDNGIGLDMKYVKNIFKPFQRLNSEERYSGSGVGLAIVHRIVTRHKGRVWVESELDKGTTVYFTLTG